MSWKYVPFPHRTAMSTLLVVILAGFGGLRDIPPRLGLVQKGIVSTLEGTPSSTPLLQVVAPSFRNTPDQHPHVSSDSLKLIVDDADPRRVEITAYWKRLSASEVSGAYGPTVLSDEGFRADAVVRLFPALPEPGWYKVYLYWPSLRGPERQLATNASVTVRHARGSEHFTVNMRKNPTEWRHLGTFEFVPELPAYVEIRNDAADGIVLADAALFCPAEAPSAN